MIHAYISNELNQSICVFFTINAMVSLTQTDSNVYCTRLQKCFIPLVGEVQKLEYEIGLQLFPSIVKKKNDNNVVKMKSIANKCSTA